MFGLLILFLVAAAAIVAVGSALIVHYLAHPPRLTFAVALARNLPTSPADLGLTFAEQRMNVAAGRWTPAWVIQGRAPAGPVVVVSHGWRESRYSALPTAGLLAPFASAVVLYDLRGQGESPAPRSRLGTAEVADLLQIVRQLEPAGRRVVLMGRSMGAGISIAAAAEADESLPIAGVIGESGYRLGMEPVVGHARAHGWPLWPFYLPVAGHLMFWYATDRRFDRARFAARLRRPLLLLHAADDPICPIRAARQIAAACPRATLVEFPSGGHLDLAAGDPARYLDALAVFFASLQEAPPS